MKLLNSKSAVLRSTNIPRHFTHFTFSRILQFANPNSFASLIILNRKWRTVSQQAHLYAHHLARCPSYSAAHPLKPLPDDDDSLPQLRRLFAREIKRNLFEAYLRPRETVINLVSTSISSSSAPGGEAFHFSLSAKGHYVLAYSSSRIHVLDVTGPEVEVKRELKILRRPASTTITDDGSLLAVLSTDMQVDLYDLTGKHPKHTRAVALDHTPRTIALSPTGSVLAAAYDSGVEVSSLDPDGVSTERRAVKCYAVDSLSFSRDGTQLLGTTIQSHNPSTVVLTAPYYDPGGNLPEESISALWTTSILFPNGSRDCSHAVLLPSPSDEEASWTFTYDRVFETFRAVRINDLRNGTTYFTGPTSDNLSKLLPSTLPAASKAGDLVSSGFQGSIWLYGVPEDLEALPNNGATSNVESEVSTPSSLLGRRNSAPSLRSLTRPRESITRTPQWQLLCDKFRNTFIEGRKVASLDRVSAMTWVNEFSTAFHSERLVAVAPGVGSSPPESEDDSMNPTDGGRISILDFNYSIDDQKRRTITIEVGNSKPEVLEEEHRDLDTEVALFRRRTVAQRRGNRNHVSRAATTVTRPPRSTVPAMPTLNDLSVPFGLPASISRAPAPSITSTDRSETASIDEDQEAFDAPYSHTSPRSGTTLRRAATAAATNRRLHPRAVAQEHVEYRRADGREEHPHESDADNWVPPPPPYTKDPIPPLPEHIQRSILAEAAAATLQRSNTQRAPSVDFPGLNENTLQRSRTFASTSSISPTESRRARFSLLRTVSNATTTTEGNISIEEDPRTRHGVSPVSPDFDDLYDVSPPESPQSRTRTTSELAPIAEPDESEASQSPQLTPEPSPPSSAPLHHIARKPVGASLATSLIPTPVMRATIQHPVSPIPQPKPDASRRQLLDWEETTETSPSESATPSPSSIGRTSGRMEQDVPHRPNEDYHLTSLPLAIPALQHQQQRDALESQLNPLSRRSETAPTSQRPPRSLAEVPTAAWRRAETLPIQSRTYRASLPTSAIPTYAVTPPSTTTHPPPDRTSQQLPLTLPSADQLARLQSRTTRPPSQILTDPRRASLISHQSPTHPIPYNNSYANTQQPANLSSSWGSIQHTPPSQTFQPPQTYAPPRGAVGAHGSPSRANTTYVAQNRTYAQPQPHLEPQQQQSAPLRRISLSNHESNSNLRPHVQRLDTICSVNSMGEAYDFGGKVGNGNVGNFVVGNGGVVRTPSRAERSAAKNIKDAKKRGWRGGGKGDREREKERKKKERWEGASSAGWTDVSEMRGVVGEGMREGQNGRVGGKKSAKCVIM
jgi:hypothetical protein